MKRGKSRQLLGVIIAGLTWGSTPATAQPSLSARADLNGDHRPNTVTLQRRGEGPFELLVDGRPTGTEVNVEQLGEEPAALRVVTFGRRQRATIFTVPLAQRGLAYEAILVSGRTPRNGITVAWAGITGLRGDPGSRWGQRVIAEDWTNDGQEDVIVASVADEVPLCGVAEPELFPQALDANSGELRPVLLNRLRGLQAPVVNLRARQKNPGTVSPVPLAKVATFVAASTTARDGGTVEGLTAPRQLDDQDPTTFWTEARPGSGTGEFVTARLLPGPYGIQALALTLAPTVEGQNEIPELGYPRTVTLVFDGSDGPRRYEVEIPHAPGEVPSQPLWITLPEAISARCFSLVLGQVFGGARAPATTALTEVALFTNFDFETDQRSLRDILHQEQADAELLLQALGPRLVPLVQEEWANLNRSARRRAIRTVSVGAFPEAAQLLAQAALEGDSQTAEAARQGLVALGNAAVPALTALLESTDSHTRRLAAALLGETGSPAAVSALVERVATAGEEDSETFRDALSATLAAAPLPIRQEVLDSVPQLPGFKQVILLAALTPPRAEEADQYAGVVAACWAGAQSFVARYHLLTLIGRASAHPSLVALAGQALLEEEDRYLRTHAAEAMGTVSNNAAAAEWLIQAAEDEWPGVRLAVAQSLGQTSPFAGVPTLSRLLADPWPVVRAAAAANLAHAGPDHALPPLVGALNDPSPMVQQVIAQSLGTLGQPDALLPLRDLVASAETPIKTRRVALRSVGHLCAPGSQELLVSWLQRGLQPQADDPERLLSATAASALGPYTDPTVTLVLAQAAREGFPGLRLAAIEALGQAPPARTQEILQQLAEDPLPPIRAAVASAQRRQEQSPNNLSCPPASDQAPDPAP